MDDLLGNPIRVRLLRVLTKSPEQGFTGRELAHLCDSSPSQTAHALAILESSGVIFREIAGRAHVWRLSKEHLLSPSLAGLFRDEADSMKLLKSELQQTLLKLPIQRAFLFGSVARGEERSTSDVDLFVQVRSRIDKEVVEEALSEAGGRFALRFGNPLSPLVLDTAHIRKPANPRLMASILHEGVELGG